MSTAESERAESTQVERGGAEAPPRRVLFVCTHNSARSHLAEALLRKLGGDRFEVESAGSEPSGRVHPIALKVIEELGGDPTLHRSKGMDEVFPRGWDVVITVCDDARDACPVLPPGTRSLHWGLEDPSRVQGSEEDRLSAFRATARELEKRIGVWIESVGRQAPGRADPTSARRGG